MNFTLNAPTVFISYRRSLDFATAGRIFDNLKFLLTDANVFMDVESLPVGRDFVVELGDRINDCEVFLLLISASWINAADERGARRLDNPDDFVRFEIETALRTGKQIIPVLIDDAEMPRAIDFPPHLAQIAMLNAAKLRHENFQSDCHALADKLSLILAQSGRRGATRRELEAFKSESTRAQRLVAERPPGWEYLLTAELFTNYLKEPLRRMSDMSAGFYSIPKTSLRDDEASIEFLQQKLNAGSGMIDPLQKVMTTELTRAWGEPGIPGDPCEILHVYKLIERAAQVMVDWEHDLRSYTVTDRLKPSHDLLHGILARQLNKMKAFPSTLVDAVDLAIARPNEKHEVYFHVVFDMPDGWERNFGRALRRAKGSWW